MALEEDDIIATTVIRNDYHRKFNTVISRVRSQGKNVSVNEKIKLGPPQQCRLCLYQGTGTECGLPLVDLVYGRPVYQSTIGGLHVTCISAEHVSRTVVYFGMSASSWSCLRGPP